MDHEQCTTDDDRDAINSPRETSESGGRRERARYPQERADDQPCGSNRS
jgi:hypothetical protein